MKKNILITSLIILAINSTSCLQIVKKYNSKNKWKIDFIDHFDFFNEENWQDQLLWVNNEDQCYVRDGQFNTREVSDGSLKLRLVSLDYERDCNDNISKFGEQHPATRYVSARLASKNLKEFTGGRWTARIKFNKVGEKGMFPAWWLLGARNNEPPVQEKNENICWPLPGSGEIDIMEHHGEHGGQSGYVGRSILPLGDCDDGGDWWTNQVNLSSKLTDYNQYSVEWMGNDLVYKLNGIEVGRNVGIADKLLEPMFAILNYAKISNDYMHGEWEMEVDWVKHEKWLD
ncbi:MAG: glycosyl hydrolase [Candidatus Marinimicrobia bacterium]|nr:glycosyl hydrolase [Candidatus Neomarinimicrobiota bacterium]|tara:strand:+ start:6122 stop:6982 length:861 start_codon:yes stop_codon:yes gene_type:complete